MKGLSVLAALLLALAGCASSSPGGAGGIAFGDCYSAYCVGYGQTGQRYLYLRTPGSPAQPQRGEVRLSQPRGASTRTVDRSPVTNGAARSVSVIRVGAAPSSPGRSTAVVHRP